MLQGFFVENFRSIDSVSIPDIRMPAVFSAEQGRNPGDIRDSFLLAARSFPGGRDGSHLLTEGVSLFEAFAENSQENTSFSGLFRECAREGTPFAELFRERSRDSASFISMSHTWVLMNPENEILPGFADKKCSGAGEFREMCRLFGERFGVVQRIILKNEVTFESRPLSESGNILSYQMLEVTVDRAYKAPLTGFYELVVYPGGTNYDLYWDTLPDVHRISVTGRAKGCNIRMSGLEIRNIVTDGVQDGADFDVILPTIMRLSEYPGRMFRDLVYADTQGEKREPQFSGMPCKEEQRNYPGSSLSGEGVPENRKIVSPVRDEAGERCPCSGLREVSGRASGSSMASSPCPMGRDLKWNRRIPWIAPNGELVHSAAGEAVDAWLSYINGTDMSRSWMPQSAERTSCGLHEPTDVDPGLLAALLLAPVSGTILLKAPLSAYESEVRTRFLAFTSAQAKLEKSILIVNEQMR